MSVDIKDLEELKELLTTSKSNGTPKKNGSNNVMTFIAVLASLAAIAGTIYAAMTANVGPINQTLQYMQEQHQNLQQDVKEREEEARQALKDRAQLEERFQEVRTQLHNQQAHINELQEWKDWWFKEHLERDAKTEARLQSLKDRFEKVVNDLHLIQHAVAQ